MSEVEVPRDKNGKIINSLDKRIGLWKTCIATAETDPLVDPDSLQALRDELAQMEKDFESEKSH